MIEFDVPAQNGDNGQGKPPARFANLALRTVVFTTLFLAGFVVWLAGWLATKEKQRPPDTAASGQPTLDQTDLMQVELSAKMLWGMEGLVPAARSRQAQQSRTQIRSLLQEFEPKKSADAVVNRKLGILTAAFVDKPKALTRLNAVARLRPRDEAQAAKQEQQMWQRIYGEQPLAKDNLSGVRETLRTLDLDWYEHLALEAAYRKAGDVAAADAEHKTLTQKSSGTFLGLVGITILLMGVGLVGLALNIVAFVLGSQGKLKFGALRQVKLPPRPLWETFALYFFLQNVPPVVFSGRWHTIWLLIPLELLPLASLLWLASQLREYGLNFGEIGLRWRGWWKEALWGVAAYLTAFPWLMAGLIVFALLLKQFQLPRPYHPIQDIFQRSPNAAMLFFLFLVAAGFAPLMEEIFFRGTLHGALRRCCGPALATGLSAAFFAILHPQAAALPLFGLPIFMLGALFSCMYELRGSIIPNIVAHGINNGIVLAVFTLVTR